VGVFHIYFHLCA